MKIEDYLNDLWKYSPSTNEWTWIGGSNITAQSGIYGTLGISNSSNIPGARYGSNSWTDSMGNFWIFGGYGYDSIGHLGIKFYFI